MAFDSVEEWPAMSLLSLDSVLLDTSPNILYQEYRSEGGAQWRRSVLTIVNDAVELIEDGRLLRNKHVWFQEAQQRALNFARLGLSEINDYLPEGAPARQASVIGAVGTLAAIYRRLDRCDGNHPVQCEHLLRNFLKNFVLAHGPVCGVAELKAELSSMVLPPVKCRALLLAASMLIQGATWSSGHYTLGGGMQVHLVRDKATHASLWMQLMGKVSILLDSAEYAIASALCGFLQADLSCSAGHDGRVLIEISFRPHRERPKNLNPASSILAPRPVTLLAGGNA